MIPYMFVFDVTYLVTMVLTGSALSVGFMMNQKNMFARFTSQMA